MGFWGETVGTLLGVERKRGKACISMIQENPFFISVEGCSAPEEKGGHAVHYSRKKGKGRGVVIFPRECPASQEVRKKTCREKGRGSPWRKGRRGEKISLKITFLAMEGGSINLLHEKRGDQNVLSEEKKGRNIADICHVLGEKDLVLRITLLTTGKRHTA